MKKNMLMLAAAFLCALTSIAQEGMWLLSQLDQLNLESRGIEISPAEIYNPKSHGISDAIIQLGGGTASFVSADGLILTNHHVAYTALQRSSDAGSDYLTNGFIAKNRSEEIIAPGYKALSLMEMKDVTDEVLKAAKKAADPAEKDRLINTRISEMTSEAEKEGKDIVAIVSEMYNGKQYVFFKYKQFKDIRIVYAPPSSIGKFGGDTDNWMWPRHTGDFSFMRVYVAPDGSGADYSDQNVPYHPKVWLKVAKEDLDEGDMTFIIGYPGFTTRYRTSNSAAWNLKHNYPFTISNFREIISIMDELTKDDPEGKIKVASLRAGLANMEKNYQGKVDGMKRTHFVEKKLEFEKEFTVWVNNSPETAKKYGNILADIRKEYGVLEKTKDRDNVFGIFQGLASTPLNIAGQLYLVRKELEKPDGERLPQISQKTVEQMKANLPYAYTNYYEPFDKALLARALRMANTLPDGQRITGLDYILNEGPGYIDKFVDEAFSSTKLLDPEYASSLYDMSSAELEALNDPFIMMVSRLYPHSEEINETYVVFGANVTELRKQYIDALYEWKGEGLYPDANGTIRFTAGPVRGYDPADAVTYHPFTTLKGVIDKNTGEEPFNVPGKLIALYEKGDYIRYVDPDLSDVPVAFTHQCDITGGNSGSPVMNARGELIGLAFDGNYEAMISDWQYDPVLQRSISVDIRYVLFITEKFSGVDYILIEMGVAN